MNYIRLYRDADYTIGGTLKVNTKDAINSMQEFKKQIKEAQGEMLSMTDKFGATSKEAVNAAKRVAELKDKLGDARNLVDAFNPDTKFKAFGASIQTVVGGFTALTGAMSLLGVESEDVQKTLVKVQSAMAISQGIAQLQEGIQSFKNLGAVISQSTIFLKLNELANKAAAFTMKLFGISVETTSTSFKVLKGAIAATGIGLLVVAVGELVSAFNDLTSAADRAAEAEKAVAESRIKYANAGLQGEVDYINRQEKLEVSRAKAKGLKESEIFNIEVKWQKQRINSYTRTLQELKETDEGYYDVRKALKEAEIDLEVKTNDRLAFERKKREEDAKAAKAKREREAAELAEASKNDLNRNGLASDPAVALELEKDKIILDNHTITNQALISSDETRRGIEKANSDEAIRQAQAETEAKLMLAQQTSMALGGLAELVGRHTAAGKILALSEIASNTAIGFIQGLVIAQKSAKGTGPAAAFAFPIFYASQIAAVLGAAAKAKGILSGGGSHSQNSISGNSSSFSVKAPLEPRPSTTNTLLNQGIINQRGNAAAPLRAIVVEADITAVQQRMTRLNMAAHI